MARLAWSAAGLVMVAGALGAAPQIENYQAQGNLEVTHRLDCITLDQFKAHYTPADIYPAVIKCLKAKRFEDAFMLYAIAGVYGRYDSLRVVDSTAHQAVSVIQMEVFGDVDTKLGDRMLGAGTKVMNDPVSKLAFCTRLHKIGPPSYYPRYMVQHGMGAFTGSAGDGLVKDFDSEAAFKSALASYMKCEIG